MSAQQSRSATVALLVILWWSSVVLAQPPTSCDIMPWQTVDNGTGAQPGLILEFASEITIPAQCQRGGRAWVPFVLVQATRTVAGATDMTLRVALRAGSGPGQPPQGFLTSSGPVQIDNVPLFPSSGSYRLNSGANANRNINGILPPNPFYPTVTVDGDQTPNQFLTTDLVGGPTDLVWVATDGGPFEPATNGIPTVNGLGVGAAIYTFYGRYVDGAHVDGREPLAAVWGARYHSALTGGGRGPLVTNLTVREGTTGPTICQYLAVPDDFIFSCTMTAPQLALLASGGIYVDAERDGVTEQTMMIPADIFIFADGFESADTTVWN